MSDPLELLRPNPPAVHDSSTSENPSRASSTQSIGRKRGVSQVEPAKTKDKPHDPLSIENIKKARTSKKDGPGEPEETSDTGYRTRASNNKHPALRPGVRTKLYEPRKDISARAAEKQAEGAAKREAKRVEQAEKEKKEKNGQAKIAEAMDASEREVREREEKNKLPFGGNVEQQAFNGGFDARAVRILDPAGAQTVSLFSPSSPPLSLSSMTATLSMLAAGRADRYREEEDTHRKVSFSCLCLSTGRDGR